jgi:hypothetical protein
MLLWTRWRSCRSRVVLHLPPYRGRSCVIGESYEGWYRVGGSRFDFYATDDEIAEWLLETLPADFAPYAIIGAEWVEEERRWQPFEYPLAQTREAFSRHRGANFWIRSDQVSPSVRGDDQVGVAYGGLILVQLGFEREDGRIEDARIAVVDRLRHEVTGEERRQPEYRRIFDRLRRSLRKRAVVETIRTRPDGGTDRSSPMTPRAAEAHARMEVTFDAEPIGLRG